MRAVRLVVLEVLHKDHPRGVPLINNGVAGTGRVATKSGVDRRAMRPVQTRKTTAMNGVIGLIVKATVRK